MASCSPLSRNTLMQLSQRSMWIFERAYSFSDISAPHFGHPIDPCRSALPSPYAIALKISHEGTLNTAAISSNSKNVPWQDSHTSMSWSPIGIRKNAILHSGHCRFSSFMADSIGVGISLALYHIFFPIQRNGSAYLPILDFLILDRT